MVKAVIFDMYETLITHFETPLYFGSDMARDMGVSEEEFLPRWRATEDDRTIGKLTTEGAIEKILLDMGMKERNAEIRLKKAEEEPNGAGVKLVKAEEELNGAGVKLVKVEEESNGAGVKLVKVEEESNGAGGKLVKAGEEPNGAGVKLVKAEEELNGAGVKLEKAEEELNGAGGKLVKAEEELNGTGVKLVKTNEVGLQLKELVNHVLQKRIEVKEDCFRHLNPEIIPMLEALKQQNIKMALISNCFSEEAQVIRKSVLFPYFDEAFLSCEQGTRKPDPAMALRCLETLQLRPAECLYVGDGGSQELEMAKKLGMKAMQATWYLGKNEKQPVGRLPEYPELGNPLAILDVLK